MSIEVSKPTLIKISATGEHLPADATIFAAVLDPAAGLMFAIGAIADELDFKSATEAVAGLTHAGFSDWRMPTIKELLSTVDYSRHSPAFDPATFPDVKSDWYWTSTPTAWSSDLAWIVNFSGGNVYDHYRNGTAWVRPVRAVSAGQ